MPKTTSKEVVQGKRIPFSRMKIEFTTAKHLVWLQNPNIVRSRVGIAAQNNTLRKWSNIDLTVAIWSLTLQRQQELKSGIAPIPMEEAMEIAKSSRIPPWAC